MVKSSQKGSAFEREVCRKLSLWFSHGKRDDIFHRTAGSGARSTTRAKQGKETANSAGDIGYLDIAGKPLIDAITFELKCGYNNVDTTSLIDTLDNRKRPQLAEFIEQAVKSGRNAQSKYWAVIHRRNSRKALIHFPMSMLNKMQEYEQTLQEVCRDTWTGDMQITALKFKDVHVMRYVITMPFENFLEVVPPEVFYE